MLNHKLASVAHLEISRGMWNMAAYRNMFSYWEKIFVGIVDPPYLVLIRMLAIILPTIFETSAPVGVSDAGQVAVTLFASRILVEHLERGNKSTGTYTTANLY